MLAGGGDPFNPHVAETSSDASGLSTGSQLTDGEMTTINIYIDFLHASQTQYPESLIVLIGCRKDKGNTFGVNLISASDSLQDDQIMVREPIRNVCILKGGIDAVKVEHPELLTKRSKQ